MIYMAHVGVVPYLYMPRQAFKMYMSVCRNLLEAGLLETEVAMISPYNGQVRTTLAV